MAGRIFINYRRGDDPGFTGWLRERLEANFAAEHLFMDVDSIAPGLDFVRVLEDQVDKCDVFLAVIGPRWLDARDEAGNRRLDNPDDFVRIEIESSLKLGKRIIPVLVNNADMPRAEHLPEGLKPLARRNAVRLTHERFKADAQGLIKALEKALEEVEADRQAASSAAAAETERRKIEDATKVAEAERQEKERARLQSVAGLSSEQIAKAEELANWEFIKESQSPQDFRDHLARFPKGTTVRMARAKLEAIVWQELRTTPQLETLEAFLAEFPDCKHTGEAKALRDTLKAEADSIVAEEERRKRETEAWATASAADTQEAYTTFLKTWSSSQHTRAGRSRLKKLAAAAPTAGPTKRRKWLAAAFAVLVLPCQLLLGLLFSGWNWVGAASAEEGGAATGLLVALTIAMSSAVALAYWRRATLSGAEIVFYWLGCTLATIYAVLFVFGMNEWNWVGAANAKDGGAATGLLVALTIAMSSAAALVYWRRATKKNDHSSIEARRL
jgi:hypothetical protein